MPEGFSCPVCRHEEPVKLKVEADAVLDCFMGSIIGERYVWNYRFME